MNTGDKRRERAFMLYEVLVLVAILSLLLVVKSRMAISSMKASVVIHSRQMCNAAAIAQLDSISYTGFEMSADEVDELWQGVSLEIVRDPGDGIWQGLEKVTVKASRALAEEDIVVTSQFRYIIFDTSGSEVEKGVADEN